MHNTRDMREAERRPRRRRTAADTGPPSLFEIPLRARYHGTAEPPEIGTDRRYRLTRTLRNDPTERPVHFIGQNPAAASATTDDHTVLQYCAYANSLRYPALIATNVATWRSTDPDRLGDVDDPFGPGNEHEIIRAAVSAGLTIVAWGNPPGNAQLRRTFEHQAQRILALLLLAGCEPHCLGTTQAGHPVHLARLRHGLKPKPYVIPPRLLPLPEVQLP